MKQHGKFHMNYYSGGLESDCDECGASNDWIELICCDECNTFIAFECRRCGHRVYE